MATIALSELVLGIAPVTATVTMARVTVIKDSLVPTAGEELALMNAMGMVCARISNANVMLDSWVGIAC